MKTKNLLLLFTSMILFACTKEKSIDQNQSSLAFYSDEGKTYRMNQLSKSNVLNFLDDEEDNEMREVSWLFGKALEEVFQNPSFVKAVINDARNSPLMEASIKRIANNNPSFNKAINDAIANNLGDEITRTTNLLHQLSTKLVYDNFVYEPVIVIPNLANLNAESTPIVSSGVDLNDKLDTRIDDDIHAVYFDNNYKKTEIYLSEKEALSTKKPVLIFSNGIDDTQFANGYVLKNIGSPSTTSSTRMPYKNFDYLHISIKDCDYHYESRRRRNEYSYTGFYYCGDSQTPWCWLTVENSSDLSKLVRKFEHCENNQVTQWGAAAHLNTLFPNPTSDELFIFNTFERDWAKSAKSLGSYTHNGNTAFLTGKRSYNGDWYIKDPYATNVNDQTVQIWGHRIALWQYLDIHSYKSKFAITRSF